MASYDLAIIGAGWAGFNAALRAKQLGLKVCLIEKGEIGGTCLNHGCIPTKTLIQSSKIYSLAKKSSTFGIDISNPAVNFPKIQQRKQQIIQQLRQGMEFMLKGIDYISAEARIDSNAKVIAGNQTIDSKNILIATGSQPIELPGFKYNFKNIISSNELLEIKALPKSLLIIGAGVIGCEFACLFSNFGSNVTLVEKMPRILPDEDQEISKKLEIIFKKRGISVNTNSDAKDFKADDFELVLVAVGRKPRLLPSKETANIYYAGDCTNQTMLAHFAAFQGRAVVDKIFNKKSMEIPPVPNCIFTDPEVASVGLSEDRAQGKDIKVQKFDLLGNAMARIMDEPQGMIKIISDLKTDQILGASIIGPKATELIAGLCLAITCRLKTADIRKTVFAHPTLSESIHAALS